MLARLIGDLVVAPASAADRGQEADFEWLGGLHHFDLLSDVVSAPFADHRTVA